jgi:hypothetical protein
VGDISICSAITGKKGGWNIEGLARSERREARTAIGWLAKDGWHCIGDMGLSAGYGRDNMVALEGICG